MDVREYCERMTAPTISGLSKMMVWDLECIKVPSVTPGWPTRLRTKPVMLGYGYWVSKSELKVQIIASNNEREFIDAVSEVFNRFNTAIYMATRDYDQNVLEGRWTYARRGLWTKPVVWPTFRGYSGYKNVLRDVKGLGIKPDWFMTGQRPNDIASKDVLTLWPKGDYDPVFEHNRKDIVELATYVKRLYP